MRVSLSVFCTNRSRYSKFDFEKKMHLVMKKKKNCWSRIPGFHPSDKKKVYLWKLGYGGGVTGFEALRLFYGKCLLAILKSVSTRLELRNYSRMFTTNHHWVWRPTHRRAIKEGSKVINRDWVKHLACRLSHYIYVISNTFVTNDNFSKLIRKINPTYNFFEFIY